MPKSLKVLYAGEDPAFEELIRTLSKKHGYPAEVVGGGKELVDRLLTGDKFDLVIADLDAPTVGHDALGRIRAHMEFEHLPIIVLTAEGLTAAIEEFHGVYWHKGDAIELFEHMLVELLKKFKEKLCA